MSSMYCIVTGEYSTRKVHYAFYSRTVAVSTLNTCILDRGWNDARLVAIPEEKAKVLEMATREEYRRILGYSYPETIPGDN